MTTLVSNPTSVTVSAPGTASALSTLASTMAAGSWARLVASNQDAVLGVGSVSGSMIQYCNKMPWNSKSRRIQIIGEDHNWGSVRYVQYDEATNQFVLVSADLGFGTSVQHGYDHNAVNPYTGDHYLRRVETGKLTMTVSKKLLASTATFTNLPLIATNYEQIGIGTCWWSGAFSGAGSQGCFMLYNSGDAFGNANDGQIAAYDPLANAWFFNKHGMAPFSFNLGGQAGYTYHSVMEYSAVKNVAVYGGGDAAPSSLWRLNADGSFTPMPNVPSGKAVGVQHGNLVCDPVTGNFLLLSAGQMWELNPSGTGTWTQQTGSRTPPAAVGVPGPNNPQGVISCALPDHGVVAYITQSSSTGGNFFLYKHA